MLEVFKFYRNENNMIKYLLALGLIGQTLHAVDYASEIVPICSKENICSVMRPLTSDDGKIFQLPYKFKYRPAKNGAPTVVFIPGGPGDILSSENPDKFNGVPDDFGVILTDPRFAGINNYENILNFSNSFTSLGVAEDILLALKSLNIKNYFLYGVSYGTVPATIASAIAKENPPRAIILDGTVGHSFTYSEYNMEFSKYWATFIQTTDKNTFTLFKDRVKSFIKQSIFTADQFGNILQALLMNRYLPNGFDLLPYFVNSIANAGTEPEAKEVIQYFVDILNDNKRDTGALQFHARILCKELSPNDHPDSVNFSFNGEGDNFVESGQANCPKYIKSKDIDLYDSKKYQIQGSVLYMQGEDDPATPVNQSLYHFKNQTAPNGKYYIFRPKGAHGTLSSEFNNCSTHFWEKLADNVKSSLQELVPCGAILNPSFTK